ncbi:unnamed protein product [Bursaphelenchus xylophilus]|uniref:(pine wood nematode) hypothetical protein n=1 Tax=Bursaphelenchus xylophilus TaxID=6326 RepID=A0A1I7RIJ6_BURXY|nr:unnamed protein product [Bursaphelenchus xylophilus]CAG9118815.1 unnamed protein product [Bursaphelenchus xylophilus]
MTTERVSNIIEQVIEQQQISHIGNQQFVKMEHESDEQNASTSFKPDTPTASEIQINSLFQQSPIQANSQPGQTVVEGGRPMKRTYLLLKEFETDEEWRTFYVTEMEHWAKKRVAKQCVEYECRLKRKGCKMALRLINGSNGRPSKALISAGQHDHTLMRPSFSNDIRAIIDRCFVENYSVKPLMVCETLKDHGYVNVSRKQVHHYLQRIRKCEEESYTMPENVSIPTQPVEQSISILSARHQKYPDSDEKYSPAEEPPQQPHYEPQSTSLQQQQPPPQNGQTYTITQAQPQQQQQYSRPTVFSSQSQIIYTNPTVQALISALPLQSTPNLQTQHQQQQQLPQVIHNQVLGTPILVHGNGIEEQRYVLQTQQPQTIVADKPPMVMTLRAQKVEVERLPDNIHVLKIYQ